MKSLAIIILLIVSINFVQPQSVNQHQEDSIMNAWKNKVMGKPLPTFIAVGDNGIITNDSLKGKVVFINMWEASCAPCMAEMSTLNKLYDTLSEYSNFMFLSVSADNMETIARIKEKFQISFAMSHLSEEACYQFNDGIGYPTVIILDTKSNVVYVHAGGYTDAARIKQFIFKDEIYPALLKELK